MNIVKPQPPIQVQRQDQSCWAAALESWSSVEPRFPRLDEQALIARWGEGIDGGINPQTKIPSIAAALGLKWRVLRSGEARSYIQAHLAASYLFCAYRNGSDLHAIIIFSFRSLPHSTMISYMDPWLGSVYTRHSSWLENRSPLVMMRKV